MFIVIVVVKRRSPKHPALFVTANISGELGLWNLNHSMEEPFAPPAKVQRTILCTVHIVVLRVYELRTRGSRVEGQCHRSAIFSPASVLRFYPPRARSVEGGLYNVSRQNKNHRRNPSMDADCLVLPTKNELHGKLLYTESCSVYFIFAGVQ